MLMKTEDNAYFKAVDDYFQTPVRSPNTLVGLPITVLRNAYRLHLHQRRP